MMFRATGPFEVALDPQPAYNTGPASLLGRMSLDRRNGSFALRHSGTMTRGAQQLVITVVPDSGDGDLEGLEGKMSIEIVDGKHSYVLEYSLPGTA